MLKSFPERDHDDGTFEGCRWVDLIDPSEEEIRTVADAFLINMPTLADLRKIETTSRLRAVGDALYMSAPLLSGTDTDHWAVAPAGFILNPVRVRHLEVRPT